MRATVWRAPEELLPQPAFETHDPSLQRTPAGGDSAAAVTVPGETRSENSPNPPRGSGRTSRPWRQGAGVKPGHDGYDGEDRAGYWPGVIARRWRRGKTPVA